MTTAELQANARFIELMRGALPRALSQAFGGTIEVESLLTAELPSAVDQLGDGRHVHIEIEASAGRLTPCPIMLLLRLEDATEIFGLDPVSEAALVEPETQLRVLAEFTEGAEALASSLAAEIAATGTVVTLRVSGASLEEAPESAQAAAAPLAAAAGDALTVVSGVLRRGQVALVPVAIALPASLAMAIDAGNNESATAGDVAADRAASLAARQAPRRDPATNVPTPLQAPAPINPVVAHPFDFGQLDNNGASGRNERNIDPILDVTLQVRVELGSTQMTVDEVLGLSLGSIVELERLAGEPVDIVINNHLLARGEVVVVEENFGVRITEIINSRQRTAAIA